MRLGAGGVLRRANVQGEPTPRSMATWPVVCSDGGTIRGSTTSCGAGRMCFARYSAARRRG
eukprot:11223969-Lingulodinium_polyedra.AAC.1